MSRIRRKAFTTLALSLRIERPPSPADVAQLVEQSIRNRQVIGSSPIVGSIIFVPLRGKPLKNFSTPAFRAPDARRSARGRPRGFVALLGAAVRQTAKQGLSIPLCSAPVAAGSPR